MRHGTTPGSPFDAIADGTVKTKRRTRMTFALILVTTGQATTLDDAACSSVQTGWRRPHTISPGQWSDEPGNDLRPRRTTSGPSEYALFERLIAEGLETGVAGLESADESVIDEVSEWLDVDAERLTMFQEAQALGVDTGLPAPMFYALGRSGMGMSLEDLQDVPIHELRTTVEEAAAHGVVGREILDNLESLVEQLAHQIVEHGSRPGGPRSGLGEVLAAADLPSEAIEQVLGRYQTRRGSASEFWESFTASGEMAEGLGDDTAREIRTAVRLSEVVGPEPALLRRMHELRREKRWRAAEDLADFSFDEWCELLEGLESRDAENAGDEDAETEDEAQERIEARAEAIVDTLEESFPSPFIHRTLSASEDLSTGARALLAKAPDHDFHNGSIRARAESDPSLLEGLDADEADAAIEQVEAVERVSRVTDRADEVAVLVGTACAPPWRSPRRRGAVSLTNTATRSEGGRRHRGFTRRRSRRPPRASRGQVGSAADGGSGLRTTRVMDLPATNGGI
jgi:hypothetical protein